jgi:hypothetical protein
MKVLTGDMHPFSRSTLGTVAIGLLVVFLTMGISGIFASAATPLAPARTVGLETLNSPTAVGHSSATSAASGHADVSHPAAAAVNVLYNFTCAVSGAGFCFPQYWINDSFTLGAYPDANPGGAFAVPTGTVVPVLVNTSGLAVSADSFVNVTLSGKLTNTTSHAVLTTFPIAPWTAYTPNANTTFDVPVTNGTLNLTWAQWIAANFGKFTFTTVVSVNVTTAGVSVWTNNSVASPAFTLLSTTAVTSSNDVQYAPITADPLTGGFYEVAPFNASFNLTLANLPTTGAGITQQVNLSVEIGHYKGAPIYQATLPPITSPVDGTINYNVTVNAANLGCTMPGCYTTFNELPLQIYLLSWWNITVGNDANNMSFFGWVNNTAQAMPPASAPNALGGLEVLFGPGFGVSYSSTTPITGYSDIPLDVVVDVTSFNVPTATGLTAWVTVRNVLTGAVQGTWSLNSTFTPADVINTAAMLPMEVNATGLGCAPTCANIATSPFNISTTFSLGWSVLTLDKAAFHATSFITVPLAGKLGISASNTINGPTSTGVVGQGNVVFNATVTGQYVAAVLVTVFSLTGAPIFTGSLLNSTTGAAKTATWFAGSTGAYFVDLNVTTDYAYTLTVSQPLAVVLAGSPVYMNQTTYHNNTILPGLSGATAGTLLLIIGLIVGIIVAMLVARMMWGGRASTAPAQPWDSKSGPTAANTCSVCGKSFATPEELSAHSKSEHGAE